jgi:hypothetical protein
MESEGSVACLQQFARGIQLITSHPVSPRFIIILPSYLRLDFSSSLFPSDFPTIIAYVFLISRLQTTWLAHPILLDFISLFDGITSYH